MKQRKKIRNCDKQKNAKSLVINFLAIYLFIEVIL